MNLLAHFSEKNKSVVTKAAPNVKGLQLWKECLLGSLWPLHVTSSNTTMSWWLKASGRGNKSLIELWGFHKTFLMRNIMP